MPNSAQACKRARQNVKTNLLKSSQRSELRTLTKKYLGFINAQDTENAQQLFKNLVKRLQQLASKKIIKKNKAARLTSRLNKKLKNLVTA